MVAFILICGVEADLPVHCLHADVKGSWTFHLGAPKEDKHNIMCSKGVTNDYSDEDNNYGLGKPNFETAKKISVHLSHPNIATTQVGDTVHNGTWTMIYDEGFEVEVAGTKFFAFSKFAGDTDNEYSHCGETWPGWYHPATNVDTQKWGCYYGKKDTAVPPVKFRKFGSRPISDDDVFVAEDELVEYVNSAKHTWTARRYEEFEGRPMGLLQKQFGSVLRPYKLQPEDRALLQSWENDELIDISDVPKQWDWRNAAGQDFVGEAINQGNCGSCYSVAVAEMITARLKIVSAKHHQKTDTPKISPDRVIKCAMYAQGCQGGFPFLASKFLQDFGAVSEDQQEYDASDGQCKDIPDDQMASRNVGYKYVGGYYGACGEKAMMRELFDHGPFVVGFEVGLGFHSYSDGVFQALGKLPEKNHFERVNHAVLIVGYGTDGDTPYWLVKNSWGPSWGEGGFFRIKRGDDNLNIEHMAVAAYPSMGAAFPPASGALVMMESKSMGHHYLALATQAGANLEETSSATTQVHANGDATADIQDPAFLKSDEVPVMEEIQEETEFEESDPSAVVAEGQDGAAWPEA
jgi:cathepsin C